MKRFLGKSLIAIFLVLCLFGTSESRDKKVINPRKEIAWVCASCGKTVKIYEGSEPSSRTGGKCLPLFEKRGHIYVRR
jgi:hypothetical protein